MAPRSAWKANLKVLMTSGLHVHVYVPQNKWISEKMCIGRAQATVSSPWLAHSGHRRVETRPFGPKKVLSP